jgi:hypothetical protein
VTDPVIKRLPDGSSIEGTPEEMVAYERASAERVPAPVPAKRRPPTPSCAATERERFEFLLHDLCSVVLSPEQWRGRPRKPLADVVFAAVLQAYVGVSSRRAMSDVTAAHEAGLIEECLSSKTLTHYIGEPILTDLLRALTRTTAEAIGFVEDRFTVERLVFQTPKYERWFDPKRGRERKRRVEIAVTFAAGETTRIVSDTALSPSETVPVDMSQSGWFTRPWTATDKAISDLTDLEMETCPNFLHDLWGMGEVDLHRAYAKPSGFTAAQAIEQRFGTVLLSKTMTAQINEVLCRLLAYNLCTIIAPRCAQ